ncbi:MAG TPA: thioredoxin family protein [Rhabdaerophilum sp.]|nr:thioredoxin family protein [Rhabdaerophilum sp.]
MSRLPDRRSILAGGLALTVAPTLARAAGTLGEDGLYHQDWFIDSFLDLAEDLATASAKGKRFAVLWGLKGCPACKKMHEIHFQNTEIVDYIKARFDIVHLNIIGAKEVTDFDGKKLGEKAFGQHYGIRTTPSLQFFPKSAEGLAALDPLKREVARMPGLLDPKPFLAMFRFVAEEGYATMPFTEWLKKDGA